MSVALGHVASDVGGDEPVQEKRSGRTGYLLLLPAILWLLVFVAVPTIQLVATSLYDPAGSLETGYAMAWEFGNYADVVSTYSTQIWRSFGYAGVATVLALLLGYPLAYAIAFKAGRWKNLMLVLVIAPFFTSFLVRTLAWKSILSDNGFVVETMKPLSARIDFQARVRTRKLVKNGATTRTSMRFL